MEIIKKETDYGLRAMIHIAQKGKPSPISAKSLAEMGEIPVEFTYKILRKFARAGIVKRFMGPKGGFIPNQEPSQITLLRIVEIIQGPISVRKCLLDYEACPRKSSCKISARLKEFQNSLIKMMANVTLADFLESGSTQTLPLQTNSKEVNVR